MIVLIKNSDTKPNIDKTMIEYVDDNNVDDNNVDDNNVDDNNVDDNNVDDHNDIDDKTIRKTKTEYNDDDDNVDDNNVDDNNVDDNNDNDDKTIPKTKTEYDDDDEVQVYYHGKIFKNKKNGDIIVYLFKSILLNPYIHIFDKLFIIIINIRLGLIIRVTI